MVYKIDQSGKVEEIAKPTVLAICNGSSYAIKVDSRTKVALRKMFGKSGRNRIYTYRIFAILIFILLTDCNLRVNEVIIDVEYTGQEKLLKNILSQLFATNRVKMPEVYFARIGNKPRVHYAAYNVFAGKEKPNRVVKLEEIMNLTTKKDRGLK